MLEVSLTKKLKEFTLTADFKLADTTMGLMGCSGSGKSMLLKCIAGIEVPDTGSISLDGQILFDSAKKINLIPQKRNIGYLFQSYALFPNMSVFENILCGLQAKQYNKKIAQEKAAQLIRRFKLTGLENRYPRQLSGGQKQRTALARLLAAEPRVILLDEPFSALDTDLKQELYQEMDSFLSSYHKTAILVSHDQAEVKKLAQIYFSIKNGKVEGE